LKCEHKISRKHRGSIDTNLYLRFNVALVFSIYIKARCPAEEGGSEPGEVVDSSEVEVHGQFSLYL